MIRNHTHAVAAAFADTGLAEAARFIRSEPRIWRSACSEREMPSRKWDLSAGYAGTMKLAESGWHAGAAEFSALLSALPTAGELPKRRMDVAGETPDIGRYLAGEPAHMGSRGRRNGKQRIVHLVIQNSFSASVSAQQIKTYGACLAAIVDRLENSGKRVELDVVQTCSRDYSSSGAGGGRMVTGWKVKRASDPLNMPDVAFSIAHPASFRRIGFGLMERLPSSFYSGVYGYPAALRESDLRLIDAEGAFIIPAIPPTATGMPGALKQAIAQVNKAAGEELLSCD